MSESVITPNLRAGGSILPMSFVKLDATAGLQCLQAGAGDTPIGVSGVWTRFPGGTASDDGNEAILDEFPGVFGPGASCALRCGGAWTPGAFLKPDASGNGTPTTAGADVAGAIALTAANPPEIGRVLVIAPTANGVAGPATLTTTAANLTLTAANSGQTITVTAADKTVTLPAGVVGYRFRVQAIGTGATGGTVGTTVAVPGTDTVNGTIGSVSITAAAGKGLINTHATAKDGDYVDLLCTAANTYYIVGGVGVWARVA